MSPEAVEQRAQADRVGPRLSDCSRARDDPILADERHDVGERADSRHLHEGAGASGPCPPTAQRLDELERHAHAGEVLVGVGAVVTLSG